MLVFEFEMVGQDLLQWQVDSLQLFFGGGYNEVVKLLLLLSNYVVNVCFIGGDGVCFELGMKGICVFGFEQFMLFYLGNIFFGYCNIQEFFVQFEKFFFVELIGLQCWRICSGSYFLVYIMLDQMLDWMFEIWLDSFMFNVVLVINLFGYLVDFISYEYWVMEYWIILEGCICQYFQVYLVDEVIGFQQGIGKERVYVFFGLYCYDWCGVCLFYCMIICSVIVGWGNEMFLLVNYLFGDEFWLEMLLVCLICINGSLLESLKLGDISQFISSLLDCMQFCNICIVLFVFNLLIGEVLLWCMVLYVLLNFFLVVNVENLQVLLLLYVFFE